MSLLTLSRFTGNDPHYIYPVTIFRSSIIWWSILIVVVWLMPVAFTTVDSGSKLAVTAWFISATGGKYGTLGLVILACLFYTRLVEDPSQKIKTFVRSLATLLLTLGLFAWINEHLIKEELKIHRPSHHYVLSQLSPGFDENYFYTFESSRRKEIMDSIVHVNLHQLKGIDPIVLDHWIDESGYSFPSGHSFNSFLVAAILAFSMKYSRSRTARRFYLAPYFWAVLVATSRVTIGAHSPLDVSFGAATGLLIGNLLLYFEPSRNIIMHRQYDAS